MILAALALAQATQPTPPAQAAVEDRYEITVSSFYQYPGPNGTFYETSLIVGDRQTGLVRICYAKIFESGITIGSVHIETSVLQVDSPQGSFDPPSGVRFSFAPRNYFQDNRSQNQSRVGYWVLSQTTGRVAFCHFSYPSKPKPYVASRCHPVGGM